VPSTKGLPIETQRPQGKEKKMELEKSEIMYAIGQALVIVSFAVVVPMVVVMAAASSM